MSSLWRVRVVGVVDRAVTLVLHTIHPDAGPFPTSRTFALRLLADQGDQLARTDGPDAYWDEQALSARADEVVESVDVTDQRNVPFDAARAQADVERDLTSGGLSATDETAWQPAFAAAWSALWADPARVPSATYTIHVTDPAWLSPLTPDLEWDTAAY